MNMENEEFMDTRSSSHLSHLKPMADEKRMRREIANSNERRRMQSINVGFQGLKSMLPNNNGEKISKAAILQQTREYVQTLEKEKSQLLIQNSVLRKKLKELCPSALNGLSPAPKRKKRDTESSDEGIGLLIEDANLEVSELKRLLFRERERREYAEAQLKKIESFNNQCINTQSLPTVAMETPKCILTETEIPPMQEPEAMNIMECKTDVAHSAPVDMPPRHVRHHHSKHHRHHVAHPGTEFTSPQSKRNLEMIAEAIRHLEGDNFSDSSCGSGGMDKHSRHSIPQSDESQTESSGSDQEDCKYDSSGCDSPMSQSLPENDNLGLMRATATLCVTNPNQLVTALPMAQYTRGFIVPHST